MCNKIGFCHPGLGLFPLLTALIMGGGILTTYTIAVSLGHVNAILPSISDTGIITPEMQIFSEVMNIVAALSFVTFIIRYKIIHAWLDEADSRLLRTLTRFNLAIGCIASLGLSIVGNFQNALHGVSVVHKSAAFMMFICTSFYCLIDALLTKRTINYTVSVYRIRLFIGIFVLNAAVVGFTTYFLKNKAASGTTFSRQHWSPKDPDNLSAIVHLTGAFIVFLLGNGYIILDSVVTYKMVPKCTTKFMFFIRLFFSLVGPIAFLFTVIGAMVAYKSSIFSIRDQRLHWKSNQIGYAPHLVSTFSEWTMAFTFVCYFLTYIGDFSKFDGNLHFNLKAIYTRQQQVSLFNAEQKEGFSEDSEFETNQNAAYSQSQPNEQTSLLAKV